MKTYTRPIPILLLLAALPLQSADEWEAVLQQSLASEHSQTRQDGLKQVDASTLKGLRALWQILANRDAGKVDWFVREGAYEALLKAEGEEASKEIDRVLKGGEGPKATRVSIPGEDELAREAIIYSIVWKLRRAVIRDQGGNDDNQIAEVKYQLRKARGVDYFAIVLPAIQTLDPEKRYLKRLQAALADKSSRVRRGAITGLAAYPDTTSIPLLLENLKLLEKQKAKEYREWVLTRSALETLTGQYFRESVEDWSRWWEGVKGSFSIEKRVEEEKEKEGEEGQGTTRVVKRGEVEVTVHMKVAGHPDGYPLLVLPWEGVEVDYFRPYFHGVEEFCRIHYVRMPRIEDFKGLPRTDENLVRYPTKVLSEALVQLTKETEGLDRFGVLAHGPDACVLGTMLLADPSQRVTHLVLINPRSAGTAYSNSIENVRREGLRTKNKEMEKGANSISIQQDGNPKYKASDSAEQGGLNRALDNLHSADPTEPETGALKYLYSLPGGVSTMNDSAWSLKTILAGAKKTDIPVLIFMGMKSVWTPISDMKMAAGQFKRATIVEMKESSELPFLSETYLFTKQVEGFFKQAVAAWKKEEAARKKDAGKETEKGKTRVKGKPAGG